MTEALYALEVEGAFRSPSVEIINFNVAHVDARRPESVSLEGLESDTNGVGIMQKSPTRRLA